MYYSVFDFDRNQYFETGKNSKTREEAVNEVLAFLLEGGESSDKEIDAILSKPLEFKEKLLKSYNTRVDEHEKPEPDDEDEDVAVYHFGENREQMPLTQTKVTKLGSKGSGWHKEPVSHSYATKYGKAPARVRGR